MINRRYIGILALAAFAAGCDDPLNPTPRQSIPQAEALDTPEEIRVAANGMYDSFQDCDGGYCRNLVVFPDLYADNLDFTGTYSTDREVDRVLVTSDNTAVEELWAVQYNAINRANNVLAAVGSVEDLDADEADVIAAEAHFVRALGYFHLVSWFGGVPIVTEPEWVITPEVNVARASEAEVWAFIESELTAAIAGLPDVTEMPFGRASMEAAMALKARVHLYQREWQQAYDLADAVIESGQFSILPDYQAVFESEQNAEEILSIPFTTTDGNALAFWFFSSDADGRWGFAPSFDFASSFAQEDERFDVAYAFDAAGDDYGYKYTDITLGADDVPVIRLAELYLIRAEAAARLGDLEQAIDDLNVIRNRAGLADIDETVIDTQTEVLLEVLEQRRLELFYEGHRFFDLRRFNDLAAVAELMEDLDLVGFRLLFPIPQGEIDANPELVQNPGY